MANDKLSRILESWVDCQKTFDEKTKAQRNIGLEEALIATGIMPEGRAHDGLDDAVNTAKLFAMMETAEEIQLIPEYKSAKEEKVETLSYSLGDLFGGILLHYAAG